MKNILRFLLSACVATAAFAQTSNKADTKFYVQPSLIIAVPGDDFETVPGVAIAAGVSFNARHSIEAEFIRFETEPERRFAGYDLYFSYLLANYKYTFPITDKFSVFAGGSVGLISQEADPRSGYFIFGDKTEETVAVGVTGGVQYQLSDRVAFAGGLKVIGQDDTRFTTSGSVLLLQGAVKFQF